MRAFILVDETKVVRCIATEECNLHNDKLYMDKYYIDTRTCPKELRQDGIEVLFQPAVLFNGACTRRRKIK